MTKLNQRRGIQNDNDRILHASRYYFYSLIKNHQIITLRFIISAFKYLQYINMKNIIFLALACLVLSDVIIQSEQSDLPVAPLPPGTAVRPGPPPPQIATIEQAPDAEWIFNSGPIPIQTPNQFKALKDSNPNVPSIPTDMYIVVITKQFYAQCLSKMTIYAASNVRFYILINGNLVISGTSPILYSATFTPICGGTNTFTMIIFYNFGPIGLIYAIVQDTSTCYNCPDGQRWNPNTCSCECRTSCCTGNQIFRPLPYCDCICKCPTKLTCDTKHYWDENSCSCQCRRPIKCPLGYKQDQTTCQCVKCFQMLCGYLGFWDPIRCMCVYLLPPPPPPKNPAI